MNKNQNDNCLIDGPLETFSGRAARFRFIELKICTFWYVPLGGRLIEFPMTMRTHCVVRCIARWWWRQVRQLSTFGQMRLDLFRTANGLNEFLMLASPVGFDRWLWLLLRRTGTGGTFNIYFGFSSLQTINVRSSRIPASVTIQLTWTRCLVASNALRFFVDVFSQIASCFWIRSLLKKRSHMRHAVLFSGGVVTIRRGCEGKRGSVKKCESN